MKDTTVTLVPPRPGFLDDYLIDAGDLLELIKWAYAVLDTRSTAKKKAEELIDWLEEMFPSGPVPNYQGRRITKLVLYDSMTPKAVVELEGTHGQWVVLFGTLDLYSQEWVIREWAAGRARL